MQLTEVKNIIAEEKKLYIPNKYAFNKLIHQKRYMIWRYLQAFRLAQYYKEEISLNNTSKLLNLYCKMMSCYYLRKRNILGEKTNIEIANHCRLGRRIQIWHGGVIINANLGDDCQIHGNNVLGNMGEGREAEIPSLGKNVDIGVGAAIIGGITIADNCIIGANAMVNKNFLNCGRTIVGIPAREI